MKQKSMMIVRGVVGRPARDANDALIPTEYATAHPFTPTLLKAVLSGDLTEYEVSEEVAQSTQPLVESAKLLVETKESPLVPVSETLSDKPKPSSKEIKD